MGDDAVDVLTFGLGGAVIDEVTEQPEPPQIQTPEEDTQPVQTDEDRRRLARQRRSLNRRRRGAADLRIGQNTENPTTTGLQIPR